MYGLVDVRDLECDRRLLLLLGQEYVDFHLHSIEVVYKCPKTAFLGQLLHLNGTRWGEFSMCLWIGLGLLIHGAARPLWDIWCFGSRHSLCFV